MPLDFKRGVVELGFHTVFEIEDKSAERRVSDKLIIGIVFIFVTSLSVYLVTLSLIKYCALKAAKTYISKSIC